MTQKTKCLLDCWTFTEERAVVALDTQETRKPIQKRGHRELLTMDPECKMETVTTLMADYAPPKGPGVRLRGIRGELWEKDIAQMISEKVHAEMNPPIPKPDYRSTTHKDFCVEGFVPLTPETTQVHDYRADQAVTFWSENRQRIQGATAVETLRAPFRKSALFSTPISERLEEIELPLDN
ncbi:sperm associated antigen 8 [Sebastes umbrosus]|uniref:sperm associated antigen 8 n=1 Tax=Sebastes umbrosus TaxID=72105 RepID=UPI00189FDDC0|nr:sperm associated antigen 8 [Sebastes umbrosus]